ncbi:Starch-binding associating with outer membrane [Catalinimonas alkaloidigena]|uniref:Starch-binding associating with outer membrane n=1 Tax=Catalinimonas alkaloidigena TaxID=1075417 RepID=A0A1G9HDE2_9BACT|nr:SusD/RagB family nutrient-binding outer membrane lipoprotein [Catalinimonas alkaloidigena]SDL10734.1 Starch-binding associating with outer membrane [Catalinimonas alkaloidigena]
MKKISYLLAGCLTVALGLSSCQDELEEKYYNPEQTTVPAIEKFFTAMQNNNRVRSEYWNVRTFLVMHPALYTQTVGFTNDTKRYQQQIDYTQGRWNDYYTGVVAQYREIQKEYNTLTEDQKATKEVFVQAAKVVYLDQTSRIVDLWGAIPFQQAGMLNLENEVVLPSYDDANSIYSSILTGLEEASTYFASASLDPVTTATFQKQDLELRGSLEGWQRYANSLRLRLLMRLSNVDAGTAQTQVMAMLNDPATYPLVDEAANNVLLAPLTTYNDNLNNALIELSRHVAPEYMLEEVMKPVNDPRIEVMFDPGANGYEAMPVDMAASEQEQGISQGLFAVFDTATFRQNRALPGIVMTSSEVQFLKAEAYLRWGSATDAEAAYTAGLEQSIAFYYYLNSLSTFKDALAAPSAEEVTAFVTNPLVALTGTTEEKLAKVWTQKWLHFGFLQSVQAWAEMRRTDYPNLTFVPDNSTPGFEMPPARLTYPNVEKQYNTENYNAVSASDTPNHKLFWDVN